MEPTVIHTAYAYRPLHHPLGHAFANAMLAFLGLELLKDAQISVV